MSIVNTYDDFYCLNLTNKPIIPLWKDVSASISFNFHNCPIEEEVVDSSLCTSMDKLKENEAEGNFIYFYYYKPILYIQPDNYTHPVKINYDLSTAPITAGYTTTMQVEIEKEVIQDDNNWLFNENIQKDYYQNYT